MKKAEGTAVGEETKTAVEEQAAGGETEAVMTNMEAGEVAVGERGGERMKTTTTTTVEEEILQQQQQLQQ